MIRHPVGRGHDTYTFSSIGTAANLLDENCPFHALLT
jgi:hypothetical protein